MIFVRNKQEHYIVPYARIDIIHSNTIDRWILLIVCSPGDSLPMSKNSLHNCYETVVIHSLIGQLK